MSVDVLWGYTSQIFPIRWGSSQSITGSLLANQKKVEWQRVLKTVTTCWQLSLHTFIYTVYIHSCMHSFIHKHTHTRNHERKLKYVLTYIHRYVCVWLCIIYIILYYIQYKQIIQRLKSKFVAPNRNGTSNILVYFYYIY